MTQQILYVAALVCVLTLLALTMVILITEIAAGIRDRRFKRMMRWFDSRCQHPHPETLKREDRSHACR